MTVTGPEIFTIPKRCIVSVKFHTDTPKDGAARTEDVDMTLIVEGKILVDVDSDKFESVRQLALWSMVPSKRADCYRNVSLKSVRGKVVVREYNFPNAFVVEYKERFSDKEGVGIFTLKIRQKKDRIEHVAVSGGYLK